MAMPDMPTPPFSRHTTFGPAAGKESISLVSAEVPLRSGPRNCGHSPPVAKGAVSIVKVKSVNVMRM
jgi:hypothetical protein